MPNVPGVDAQSERRLRDLIDQLERVFQRPDRRVDVHQGRIERFERDPDSVRLGESRQLPEFVSRRIEHRMNVAVRRRPRDHHERRALGTCGAIVSIELQIWRRRSAGALGCGSSQGRMERVNPRLDGTDLQRIRTNECKLLCDAGRVELEFGDLDRLHSVAAVPLDIPFERPRPRRELADPQIVDLPLHAATSPAAIRLTRTLCARAVSGPQPGAYLRKPCRRPPTRRACCRTI